MDSRMSAEDQLAALHRRVAELEQELQQCQATEAAQHREFDLLQRLLETSPVVLVSLDRDGCLTFANRRAEEVIGVSREALLQRPYNAPQWKISHYDGSLIPNEELPFARVMATGEPVIDARHAIVLPDGRRIFLSVSGAPLHGPDGELEGAVFSFEDISHQVRVHEELAAFQRHLEALVEERTADLLAANERLRHEMAEREIADRRGRLLGAAIGAAREGVLITDARLELPGPRILFVNDYFCEMTGYSRGELLGQTPRMMQGPRSLHSALDRLRQHLRAGEPFRGELVNHRKDGSDYASTVHISPVTNDAGEITHFVSIQQDVSETKRADEALRSSEERYRLLIERMNEGFAATDRDNRFDLVNAKLVEMLGFSREELRGRYIGELVEPTQRAILEAEEARRRRGESRPYEITWRARGGRRVDTVVSPTPLSDADGRFIGSFAVVTDITERKRAEEERRQLEQRVRQAQKLESLGLLAGGVAHDFNNLLVGILGNAGLALMDLPESSPVRPTIEQIETAAIRAAELTKEMLAYAGKGKIVVDRIELSPLVEEMAHLLEVTLSKKVTLSFDFAENLPPIEGDPTQIRQVVMNLITNASEAIGDQSGQVTIRTGVTYADQKGLTQVYLDDDLKEGSYVFLEVSDTGGGMDAATRAKIFDPFFTTKFTGRGLGLAAVLGIVRGHRGGIQVESEIGRGTVFRVLFPPSDRPPQELVPAVPVRVLNASGCILVVDDEATVRRVAVQSLERVGYSVLTAADGVEAVDVFRQNADRISAVLLDVTMPRMSGEEAFHEIRRLRGDAKIVLASGFNEQEAVTRFAGKALAGFLQKPFGPQQLIEMMQRVTTDAPGE